MFHDKIGQQNDPVQELDDLACLQTLESRLTAHMGGVLPDVPDAASLVRVLDVGCGSGNWLLETARCYPSIEQLVGIDLDGELVAYGRAMAKVQGLERRVRLKTMDARQRLPFPDASFCLVNQRLGACWACTWDWRKLLAEYQRLTRPGGLIRLTEISHVESSSTALNKLQAIMDEAEKPFGASPLAERTVGLQDLMSKHGIKEVTSRHLTLVQRTGTMECECYRQKMTQLLQESFPDLARWMPVPGDYRQMCEQALKDLRQPDLQVRWDLLMLTGNQPVLTPGLMSC
jgi:SAM-dependent methyltransferase